MCEHGMNHIPGFAIVSSCLYSSYCKCKKYLMDGGPTSTQTGVVGIITYKVLLYYYACFSCYGSCMYFYVLININA